jgi:uncharacterized membrane protein YhaH (DUF805 family)
MNLLHWALLPYRRYAQFGGRSMRMEFWLYFLFTRLVGLALDVGLGGPNAVRLGLRGEAGMAGNIATAIFGILSIVPTLAVTARRLHDTNRSQWWMALVLVPILGWLALLIFLCQEGTQGPNRFGEDRETAG